MKNIKKIITTVCLGLCITPLTQAQDIEAARQLIENERFQSAEQLLEKNIDGVNTDPQVNYLLVTTYLEQDKLEEAGKYVDEHVSVTANDDADPFNHVAKARYLLGTGKKAEAENILNALYGDRKNQKDPKLLLAMAEAAIEEENGDARQALTWLESAEKRDRDNAQIDIAKGMAYRKLGDGNNAYLSYENAIKKDPRNVRAHYLLGKIFRGQKNVDIYMKYFNKAYQLDSNYAPVLDELYDHYYYRDIATAKKYLEKFIANTDYSVENDYHLIDVLYLSGNYDQAISSANSLIQKLNGEAQPRMYKLMAYSYAKKGDSTNALSLLEQYFQKESASKLIASDFELKAQLNQWAGKETAATDFIRAFELDSLASHKADYATSIAKLYGQQENYKEQAAWLGKLYSLKSKTNNLDLFNWGLAHYKAGEYAQTDSVFKMYTERYPEDIYGYYWRAQANASIDTSMKEKLAIPFYEKVVEIGEQNKETNKKMLMKAYGYLGGYEANVSKDYEASLKWFEKYLELDSEDKAVKGYTETLRKWIANKKE